NLDPSTLSNFRPISNLSFLSKLMEKLVFTQLKSHFRLHDNGDTLSGFRSRHSTESALLRVRNDILRALDGKSSVVLVLRDLTAAFDTMDHAILISHPQHVVSLQGAVLNWFSSYLSNRTISVVLNDHSSLVAPLSSGVPQGSILGPIMFSRYMLPLGQLISNHKVQFHFYADDLQIYLPVILSDSSALDSLHNCLQDVKQWLSQKFLHLNEEKSKYILFSPDSPSSSLSFGPLTLQFAPTVLEIVKSTKFLGVHLADNLTWSLNTCSITKKAQQHLYFLRRLRKANLPPLILIMFYRGTIESILSSCITAWFGNCTVLDRKTLQRIVRTAEKIIGVSLPSIMDIYTTHCIHKANSIVVDPTHPSHTLFTLLPSGKRFRSIRTVTFR
ncbi:gastrula zinc finger protein XlCGF28.1-like, partial [Silurus meridionalis]